MDIEAKPKYATIGSRLSMQMLSENRYGYPGGKFTSDFLYDVQSQNESPISKAFEYKSIPTENVNFFDGPDIVLGFSENRTGLVDKPHIVFIYDDLDFENLALLDNFYPAYQARVLFEEGLKLEDYKQTCSALMHALSLMTLQSNLKTLIHEKHTPIILGIHEDIDNQFPMVSATIVEAAFKQDDRYISDHRVKLFHKNTRWNLAT